jgi:hypothetical protein
MSPGQHKLEVMAEDNQGSVSATILNVSVRSQGQNTISGIQDMSPWQNCSADFPPGSGRDGQVCASGNPGASSTLTPNQTSPPWMANAPTFTSAVLHTPTCSTSTPSRAAISRATSPMPCTSISRIPPRHRPSNSTSTRVLAAFVGFGARSVISRRVSRNVGYLG